MATPSAFFCSKPLPQFSAAHKLSSTRFRAKTIQNKTLKSLQDAAFGKFNMPIEKIKPDLACFNGD